MEDRVEGKERVCGMSVHKYIYLPPHTHTHTHPHTYTHTCPHTHPHTPPHTHFMDVRVGVGRVEAASKVNCACVGIGREGGHEKGCEEGGRKEGESGEGGGRESVE